MNGTEASRIWKLGYETGHDEARRAIAAWLRKASDRQTPEDAAWLAEMADTIEKHWWAP